MVRFIVAFLLAAVNCPEISAQLSSGEYYKSAKVKYDDGKYDESIDFLDKAINADSTFESAYLLRGCALLALEKYSMAIDDFSHVIDRRKIIDPSLSDYHFFRGLARTEIKEYFSAEKDFAMAIRLKP